MGNGSPYLINIGTCVCPNVKQKKKEETMKAQKESKKQIENFNASLFAKLADLLGEGEQCPHCDSFLSLDDTLESRTGFNWCPVCRELVRKL